MPYPKFAHSSPCFCLSMPRFRLQVDCRLHNRSLVGQLLLGYWWICISISYVLFSFINLPWIFFLLIPWSSYILRNVANVKFPTIILFLMTVRLFWDIRCNSILSICFHQALCIFLYKRASGLKPKSVTSKMWPLKLLYVFWTIQKS